LRFEHVLQIYWSKGLFFGGKLFYPNKIFKDLFYCTPALGLKHKKLLLIRLELLNSLQFNMTYLKNFKVSLKREIIGFLNSYYSHVHTVNDQLSSLTLLNIVKMYLTKVYKGKCHLLGKPARGQRTWSNAWTSFKKNLILRKFVSEIKLKLSKEKKPEKINYKLIKKKYGIKKNFKKKVIKQTSLWL